MTVQAIGRVSRLCRYVPMLMLAALIVTGGFIVRDFLQSPDQFVSIQSAFGVGK